MARAVEISQALREIGVGRDDVVFVHADLRRLGLVRRADGSIGLSVEPADLLTALHDAGGVGCTIVVPSFSYVAQADAVFSVADTPAKTGAFAEFTRRQPGARRSLHPMLSVAALGQRAREIVDGVGERGFGPNSPYERLLGADALLVMVGVPYCSFKDHVEVVKNVPYRYEKQFRAVLQDGGRKQPVEFVHSVRYRDAGAETVLHSFLEGLLASERTVLKTVRVGAGDVRALRATQAFELLSRILERDPWRFVRETSADRSAIEYLQALADGRVSAELRRLSAANNDHANEIWEWQISSRLAARASGGDRQTAGTLCVGGEASGCAISLRAAAAVLNMPVTSDDKVIRFVELLLPQGRKTVAGAAAPPSPARPVRALT